MRKNKYISLFVTIVVAGLLATACGAGLIPSNPPTAATETPAVAMVTMAPTMAPETTRPQPTNAPTAAPLPTESAAVTTGECKFDAPTGDPDNWAKTLIDVASMNTWFHRVYNPRLFNEANAWGGADSWFVSIAVGPNGGGFWTSFGNPGQVIYRQTTKSATWCLGALTTSQWKEQFMGTGSMPAAINVRVTPNTLVYVTKASGKTVSQTTSDGGDLTIVLPDDGQVAIWTSFTTGAPTFESLVWWGPYDRSAGINTVDASK